MFDEMLQYPVRPFAMERRWKSSSDQVPNCPRCASPNTKFCYYNNYSLSQPRYFCKGCRRYWTKGGSLRNVPVGGGCRRGRRAKSARSSFPTERLGPSYTLKPPSPGGDNSLTAAHSEGSSEIDLAAVFAKYLNQNSGPENKVIGEDYSSGSNSTQLENLMAECEDPLSDGFRQVYVDEDEFFVPYPNAFDLQGIFGDELPPEVSWPDSEVSPNFGWQPVAQLQEFGSFLPDEQLKIPANLASDNWNSFDLLGNEIFSRH